MNVPTYVWALIAMAAAPLVGGILSGLDRKITARIQGRIGPPVLQPFYDVIKLLGKEALAVNRVQIMYAYLHLAFMMAVVALLAMGQDMLLVLFVHAFGTIALIIGGMCVRSPYSRIGAQRKIMQMVAYEPILVLLVMGIYLVNKVDGQRIFMSWSIPQQAPLLLSLPLVFAAFLAAVAIKLHKSPFDVSTSHHAHQELVKGVTLEYAGPYLALIEIADFYEIAILFGVMAAFWAAPLWIGLGLAVVSYFAMIVLDNAFARLQTMWMIKWMWSVPTVLALGNVIWLYYR